MRSTTFCTLIALLAVSACAAGAPAPAHEPDEYSSAGETPGTLPRYFAVELTPERMSALGQEQTLDQLRERATVEAADPTLRGATVVAEAGVSEDQVVEVVRLLVRAGFRHVVYSGRSGLFIEASGAGDEQEAVSTAPAPLPVEPALAPSPAEVSASSSAQTLSPEPDEPLPVPDNVEVKQLGLHVGGGPNDEPTHALYSNPITPRFDELARCYPLAQGASKSASFGVDLLIASRGGKAKIKDYRTVLAGKDFHLCVLGVFGSVEFPAPGKPTMVSYSVLFKPR
jgi:hypothetical protein